MRIAFFGVAAAGVAALVLTDGAGGPARLWGLLDPWEMTAHLGAARAILNGSLHHWYLTSGANGYLPPFELLAVPLAPLPDPAAAVVGRCLVVVALVAALLMWKERDGGVGVALVPALLSLPAMHAVVNDHVFSAIGLLALSAALWAQRRGRWYLAGAAVAIGTIRLANAVPVIAMLAVAAYGTPRNGARALAAAFVVMGSLVALTTIVDPSWLSDYRHAVAQYPLAGWPRIAAGVGGNLGVAALQLGVGVAAALLVVRQARQPLDPDRTALGLALSIVSAPGEGPYSGIFALPALARVGGRPGLALLPWIASGTAWVALVIASMVFTGADWATAWSLFTLVGTWFLIHGYPLVRRRAAVDAAGASSGAAVVPPARA